MGYGITQIAIVAASAVVGVICGSERSVSSLLLCLRKLELKESNDGVAVS